MFYSLIAICVILLGIVFFIVPASIRASRRLQAYEDFYENTLEDVGSVIKMLEDLMKRQLISDDPDVQNFYRIMAITHDTLLRYRSAGDGQEKKKK